jgi:hypothetical protein
VRKVGVYISSAMTRGQSAGSCDATYEDSWRSTLLNDDERESDRVQGFYCLSAGTKLSFCRLPQALKTAERQNDYARQKGFSAALICHESSRESGHPSITCSLNLRKADIPQQDLPIMSESEPFIQSQEAESHSTGSGPACPAPARPGLTRGAPKHPVHEHWVALGDLVNDRGTLSLCTRIPGPAW